MTKPTQSENLSWGRTGGWEERQQLLWTQQGGRAVVLDLQEHQVSPGPPLQTLIPGGPVKPGRDQTGVGAASGISSFGESSPGQAQDQELFAHWKGTHKRSLFYLELLDMGSSTPTCDNVWQTAAKLMSPSPNFLISALTGAFRGVLGCAAGVDVNLPQFAPIHLPGVGSSERGALIVFILLVKYCWCFVRFLFFLA